MAGVVWRNVGADGRGGSGHALPRVVFDRLRRHRGPGGTRRPIVGAWNCVLLALLVVLLLPLAESVFFGTPLLDPPRLLFAVGTVGVGVVNYLPTRRSLPVLLIGAACVLELLVLTGNLDDATLLTHVVNWLLPMACWVALVLERRVGAELARIRSGMDEVS